MMNGGSFWSTFGGGESNEDAPPLSPLDTLLQDSDCDVEALLHEPEVLQEFKTGHDKLVTRLSQEDALLKLFDLITTEPPEDASEERKFRYPFVTVELISCGPPTFFKAIVDPAKPHILVKLFSFLNQPADDINPVLAGYFSRATSHIHSKHQAEVAEFVHRADSVYILDKFLERLHSRSIAELLTRLLVAEENDHVCFAVEGLAMRLLKMLRDATTIDAQENISLVLLELIAYKDSLCYSEQLTRQLTEPSVAWLLLDCIFDFAARGDSAGARVAASILSGIIRHTSSQAAETMPPTPALTAQSPGLMLGDGEGDVVNIGVDEIEEVPVHAVAAHAAQSPPRSATGSGAEPESEEFLASRNEVLMKGISDHFSKIGDLIDSILSREATLQLPNGRVPSAGMALLEVLNLLALLANTGSDPIFAAIERENLLPKCIEILFRHPWSTLLHNAVRSLLGAIFSPEHGRRTLVLSLLRNNNYAERLVTEYQLQQKANQARENPVHTRAGYMGHIYLLSVDLRKYGALDQEVADHLGSIEAWETVVVPALEATAATYSEPLGGGVHEAERNLAASLGDFAESISSTSAEAGTAGDYDDDDDDDFNPVATAPELADRRGRGFDDDSDDDDFVPGGGGGSGDDFIPGGGGGGGAAAAANFGSSASDAPFAANFGDNGGSAFTADFGAAPGFAANFGDAGGGFAADFGGNGGFAANFGDDAGGFGPTSAAASTTDNNVEASFVASFASEEHTLPASSVDLEEPISSTSAEERNLPAASSVDEPSSSTSAEERNLPASSVDVEEPISSTSAEVQVGGAAAPAAAAAAAEAAATATAAAAAEDDGDGDDHDADPQPVTTAPELADRGRRVDDDSDDDFVPGGGRGGGGFGDDFNPSGGDGTGAGASEDGGGEGGGDGGGEGSGGGSGGGGGGSVDIGSATVDVPSDDAGVSNTTDAFSAASVASEPKAESQPQEQQPQKPAVAVQQEVPWAFQPPAAQASPPAPAPAPAPAPFPQQAPQPPASPWAPMPPQYQQPQLQTPTQQLQWPASQPLEAVPKQQLQQQQQQQPAMGGVSLSSWLSDFDHILQPASGQPSKSQSTTPSPAPAAAAFPTSNGSANSATSNNFASAFANPTSRPPAAAAAPPAAPAPAQGNPWAFASFGPNVTTNTSDFAAQRPAPTQQPQPAADPWGFGGFVQAKPAPTPAPNGFAAAFGSGGASSSNNAFGGFGCGGGSSSSFNRAPQSTQPQPTSNGFGSSTDPWGAFNTSSNFSSARTSDPFSNTSSSANTAPGFQSAAPSAFGSSSSFGATDFGGFGATGSNSGGVSGGFNSNNVSVNAFAQAFARPTSSAPPQSQQGGQPQIGTFWQKH